MKSTLSRHLGSLFIVLAIVAAGAAYVAASDSSSVAYGSTQSITAFSACRDVVNSSTAHLSVYVPTVTSAEWTSFQTNPPSGITVTPCEPCGSKDDVKSVAADGTIVCRNDTVAPKKATSASFTNLGDCSGVGCHCGTGTSDWRCEGKTYAQVCNPGGICPVTFSYDGVSYTTRTQCTASPAYPVATVASYCTW